MNELLDIPCNPENEQDEKRKLLDEIAYLRQFNRELLELARQQAHALTKIAEEMENNNKSVLGGAFQPSPWSVQPQPKTTFWQSGSSTIPTYPDSSLVDDVNMKIGDSINKPRISYILKNGEECETLGFEDTSALTLDTSQYPEDSQEFLNELGKYLANFEREAEKFDREADEYENNQS